MPINVLFIVIDCLRADHVSAYGYERNTTLNLDKLAKRGVLARNAFTQSTFTVASAASILTGVYPEVHHAIGFYDRLPSYLVTLPEYLSRYGFDTTCFEGMHAFAGPWGLGRGFNKVESSFGQEEQTGEFARARADEICSRFVDYISSRSNDRPFFSILWFAELHDPQIVPEEERQYFRKSDGSIVRLDQYDSALRYVDQYIGKILGALDENRLLDDTFIVVTGDHGDVFDEHFWFEGHLIADFLYKLSLPFFRKILTRNGYLDHLGIPPFEGVIHVPLILKFPENKYNGEIKGLIELIDLFPTTLDLLNLKTKSLFQGRSIIPDLEDNQNGKKIVFTYTKPYRSGALFTCARGNEFKFVKIYPPNINIKNISSNPKQFIAHRIWSGEKLFKVDTSEKQDFSKEYPEHLHALKRELLLSRKKNKTFKEKIRLHKAISRVK